MNQTSKKIQYKLSNGTNAYFSKYKFKAAIHRMIIASGKTISQQVFLEDMAEATGNSFSAIKHWLAGHNAPSDLEKVQAIANFLEVELTDLLETEMENNTMTNTVVPIKAVDFTEKKNTVRDIYIRMADYIELFRGISVNYDGNEPLVEAFPALYSALMHARLDLPKELMCNLSSFAVNYLQQMYCFLRFAEAIEDSEFITTRPSTAEAFFEAYATAYMVPDICPWFADRYISIDEKSEDGKLFEETLKRHFYWDAMENFCDIPNEVIINAAYDRLEEILKEYRAQ